MKHTYIGREYHSLRDIDTSPCLVSLCLFHLLPFLNHFSFLFSFFLSFSFFWLHFLFVICQHVAWWSSIEEILQSLFFSTTSIITLPLYTCELLLSYIRIQLRNFWKPNPSNLSHSNNFGSILLNNKWLVQNTLFFSKWKHSRDPSSIDKARIAKWSETWVIEYGDPQAHSTHSFTPWTMWLSNGRAYQSHMVNFSTFW